MKILFVVENYYPRMSGVPVVVQYLAEGMVSKQHEVHVVTRDCDNTEEYELHNNVHIHRFKIHVNLLKRPKGETTKYVDYILSNRWDVVIIECAQCVTTDLILPHLKKVSGLKVFHAHGLSALWLKLFEKKRDIYHTIGNTINYIIWNYYYKYGLFKKSVKEFDRVLTISSVDKDTPYFEKNGIYPVTLSNAAEDAFFKQYYNVNKIAKYANLENKKYMISVANYSNVKNQEGILKEYYKLKNKTVSMVFVGSESNTYYDNLLKLNKRLSKQFGKRDVHFLTDVARVDIADLVKFSQIYLIGSTLEGFSISLIEAMALGVPFVSTNVGNAYVLPGGVTIDSLDKMHSTVDDILSDEEKRRYLSDAGKRYAYENCRIDTVVNKLELIIKDTMKEQENYSE